MGDPQVHNGLAGRAARSMRAARQFLLELQDDESGQDLIEYALIVALIALGATATLKTLAGSITGALSNIGTKITDAV